MNVHRMETALIITSSASTVMASTVMPLFMVALATAAGEPSLRVSCLSIQTLITQSAILDIAQLSFASEKMLSHEVHWETSATLQAFCSRYIVARCTLIEISKNYLS